jgi:hypothetical protein
MPTLSQSPPAVITVAGRVIAILMSVLGKLRKGVFTAICPYSKIVVQGASHYLCFAPTGHWS